MLEGQMLLSAWPNNPNFIAFLSELENISLWTREKEKEEICA